jgi:anaerobic selenocysteine-containing dehydrogenase
MNPNTSIKRRAFLRTVAALSGAAAAGLGSAPASAQQKMPPAKVQYQASPKDGKQCSTCQFWEGGTAAKGTCKLVEGEVAAKGWCSIYVAKP